MVLVKFLVNQENNVCVFPYNEHQVEDARKYAMDLGFEEFEPVKSIRKYHYLNEEEKQLIEWQ